MAGKAADERLLLIYLEAVIEPVKPTVSELAAVLETPSFSERSVLLQTEYRNNEPVSLRVILPDGRELPLSVSPERAVVEIEPLSYRVVPEYPAPLQEAVSLGGADPIADLKSLIALPPEAEWRSPLREFEVKWELGDDDKRANLVAKLAREGRVELFYNALREVISRFRGVAAGDRLLK